MKTPKNLICPKREYHTSRRHQEESEISRYSASIMSHWDIMCEIHTAPRIKNKRIATGKRMEIYIFEEIKKIKDTFGPKKDRDNRSVSFKRIRVMI